MHQGNAKDKYFSRFFLLLVKWHLYFTVYKISNFKRFQTLNITFIIIKTSCSIMMCYPGPTVSTIPLGIVGSRITIVLGRTLIENAHLIDKICLVSHAVRDENWLFSGPMRSWCMSNSSIRFGISLSIWAVSTHVSRNKRWMRTTHDKSQEDNECNEAKNEFSHFFSSWNEKF